MANREITLHEMLIQRRVPELRKQISNWMVKGASKMRKDELVSTLEHELLRPGNLDEMLLMAGDAGWQLIQDAAVADDPLQVPTKAVNYARMFAEFGYLQYKGDKQAGTVRMPVEIKKLLSTLKEGGFYERKARADLLFAYSQAAVNLYGVIDQKELLEIINRQVEKKTDLDELLQSQIRHLDINALYCHIPQVADVLNISRASAYELAHRKNFPAMLIGCRIVVPKDKLLAWIDAKVAMSELCS